MKNHIHKLIILIFFISFFVGVSTANNSNQNIITYYVLIEPDLEGNAYFQINVQNFDYNSSKIFGIAQFEPNVENYTSIDGQKSYDYEINSPNTAIDIYYDDGKIETIDYYSGELEFLGDFYFDLPVMSQKFYVATTDKMEREKISNFVIKFYDISFHSDRNYEKYPFDDYTFTYDIIFLNESYVSLIISPDNPNNYYNVNVTINHIYKNKFGSDFEEPVDLVYDGTYKINFRTEMNESLDKINIIYTRKNGLAKISFYSLVIIFFCVSYIVFSNKMSKELNTIVFGTFLTIYTFFPLLVMHTNLHGLIRYLTLI